MNYDGTLITISHDRHFLNCVTTHTADIDYETIITYTGGYDDMVMAEDADPLHARVAERAARKEDCAAQRVHCAVRGRHAIDPGDQPPQGSGAAADQRTGAVEHSAPVHQVRPGAAQRQACAGVQASTKFYGDQKVIDGFTANVLRGEKICLMGRNGAGKTTLLKSLLANYPGLSDPEFHAGQRRGVLGTRGAGRVLSAGCGLMIDSAASRTSRWRTGCTAGIRRRTSRRFAAFWARCCSRGEEGAKPTEGALRRRAGAAAVLQADADQAEHSDLRRADQPSRSRSRSTR